MFDWTKVVSLVSVSDCMFQETTVQGLENSAVGKSCDSKHPKQEKHRIPQYPYPRPKKLSDLQQQTLQKVWWHQKKPFYISRQTCVMQRWVGFIFKQTPTLLMEVIIENHTSFLVFSDCFPSTRLQDNVSFSKLQHNCDNKLKWTDAKE